MKGQYQRDVDELPDLGEYRFENVFRVHKTGDQHFYNILKSITMPDVIPPKYYFTYTVDRSMPYTALSYMMYKTIDLWWLICTVNKIHDPTSFIAPGSIIKIIRQSQVPFIIDEINNQLV